MRQFRKRKLTCLYILGGILCFVCYHFITTPPVEQSLHRYLFGHNIIRRRNALNSDAPRDKYCDEPFPYGTMCPTPYSELAPCELAVNGTWNCPDVRHMASTKLRQTQLVLTRMLRIFDLVSRKHNIPYWMRSGTLIGAIRHRGFVPWDDDIDIEIPLLYYDQFHETMSAELPKDIFFQTCDSDKHFADAAGFLEKNCRPKLRDKSSCYKYCFQHGCKWHDGLQVDVFVHKGSLNGIFPLREMQFEGFNFLVSNNWEDVISAEYPGFMHLPEKEKRVPKNKQTDPLRSCEELETQGLDTPIFVA